MKTIARKPQQASAIQALNHAVRWFVGVLFIFSGLIKLNDPVGTQIKLTEYFEVFAADLPALAGLFHALIPAALVLAVVLCVAEVVLGVALLVRYRLQTTLWVLLGLIVFFTFLTFYSAWFNKVTDCGCFGDAIKLTPWQSFGKDILLLVLLLWLFSQRHRLDSGKPSSSRGILVGASVAVSLAVALYAIFYLPLVDFLPYKKGASIPENMKLPPGAKPDVYVTYYTMKNAKTGEQKEVSDKEYIDTEIWKDESWQIAATSEPRLVQKGTKPKITDFAVSTPDGQNITERVFQGNKLLIVIADVQKGNKNSFAGIQGLIAGLKDKNVEPLFLTSSDEATFEAFRHEYQWSAPFYLTDATVLKTMIRTNPGVILLRDGVVLEKWPAIAIPAAETVQKELL
jgi:uncharacterized membrane protein YphA (DoxX/SURF4 family)